MPFETITAQKQFQIESKQATDRVFKHKKKHCDGNQKKIILKNGKKSLKTFSVVIARDCIENFEVQV